MRVGVFCGGNSSERTVSIRSGKAVLESLLKSGVSAVRIDPRNSKKTRQLLSSLDVAFIALHGHGGEDGTLQKHLEKVRIPYVGSNPRGSRFAFNKVLAKKIFQRKGIPTPPWRTFDRRTWQRLRDFPTPFFVKPINDGSSIGVFRVEDFRKSAEKLMKALRHYPILLAEQEVVGREFTVGVLQNRALPVIELRPKRPFYDYRAKYTKGMTDYWVPAPIPDSWRRNFQNLALRVHRALGLRDFCRVDLMSDFRGNAFVLEANTIPGFTELSLLPKAAREAGISFESLCRRLVNMAWRRAQKRRKFFSNGKA